MLGLWFMIRRISVLHFNLIFMFGLPYVSEVQPILRDVRANGTISQILAWMVLLRVPYCCVFPCAMGMTYSDSADTVIITNRVLRRPYTFSTRHFCSAQHIHGCSVRPRIAHMSDTAVGIDQIMHMNIGEIGSLPY